MSEAGPIKLVISDVDGTLVNKAKQLTDATVAAVKRLEEAGVAFTLISARPPLGIAPMIERLGVTGPVAAYNGGTIYAGDHVIERHVVDPEVVRGMVAIVGDAPVSRWVFADGRWRTDTLDNPHVPHERISANQEPVVTPDMAPLYERVEKLTFVSDDPGLLARLTREGQARFGARATIGQSQTYYLDVTDLAANKGDGVAALARAHGVPLSDVAVLGDMDNDVPMFDRAGLAVAMGQAPDRVKAKADRVSSSNEENGVAYAIDQFIMPRIVGHAAAGAEA